MKESSKYGVLFVGDLEDYSTIMLNGDGFFMKKIFLKSYFMVVVMYCVFFVLAKIELFKCPLYLDLTPYLIAMMMILSTSDFKNCF